MPFDASSLKKCPGNFPLLSSSLFFFLLKFLSANHYEKFFEIEGGPKDMYYYAKFSVGGQPAEQSVIIDTGSDTLAFPCADCVEGDCGSHQDHRFQSRASASFAYEIHCPIKILYHGHKVCQFVKSYAEGSSILGFLGSDFLRFRNARQVDEAKLDAFNFQLKRDLRLKAVFGCTTKETGLFKSQFADGILGLDNASSFIESMEQKNSRDRPLVFSFGLCFHSHGGIMSVDLRDPSDRGEKIVMLDKKVELYSQRIATPLVDLGNNYYIIEAERFFLNEENLRLPRITFMIDSGTTFTHFPESYLKTILGALEAFCRAQKDKCGKIPNPEFKEDSCLQLIPDDEFPNEEKLLESFPSISIYFKGSQQPFVFFPKNYFYKEFSPDKSRLENEIRLCLALRGDESDRIIFGAFGIVDYYVYFDRIGKRIQFFKEDCSTRSAQVLRKKTNARILAELPIKENKCGVLILGGFVLAGVAFAVFVGKLRKRLSEENLKFGNL